MLESIEENILEFKTHIFERVCIPMKKIVCFTVIQ